ncbi:hypothetical protein [Streptomyces sp. NPDC058394]|uniref:hypothetical protein n=1 Tax=Streptomyces sp. NPDC058394 TaxID=3346477 RepID=UPI00364DD55A
MAKPKTTQPTPNTPPAVGKTVHVRVDDGLHDSLATIMRTGVTVSDAVRLAAAFVAHGFESAWGAGAVPDGKMPRHMLMKVRTHDTPQPPDQRV